MITNKTTILLLFLLLLIIGTSSCSKDEESGDDYGNAEDGYALKSANGHSFQFYNSSKWLFSVAVNGGSVQAKVQDDRVLDGEPTFSYEKTGKNTAESWISITYKYMLGGKYYYGGYIANCEMTFTSAKKGNYQLYDVGTGKPGSSGKFTVDEN